MKLTVSKVQSTGFVEVTAWHKDHDPLVWAAGAYGKVRLADPTGVFNEINAYWATCHEEIQDALWECYKGIHAVTRSVTDSFYVAQSVRFYVNKMYSLMPMESFKHWLLLQGRLHVPNEIQDSITEGSRYTDEGQTYLKSDYINLAIFSLAIRPMLPVWGAYIDLINDNQKGKELEALGLASDTEMMDWPEHFSVYEKLQRYIDERINDNSISMASTWKGLSSSEIPKLILAKVIVRRLTIAVMSDPQATSIISSVHWYIRYCLNPADRTTAERVNDKKIDSKSGDEDDKTSFIDAHKIKQKVVIGDATAFEEDATRPALLAQKVDPTIDLQLLEKCLACIPKVEDYPLEVHQKRLAQWVLAKAFSAKAFPHIEKQYIHNLVATAQALLWHWGFIDIALIMQVSRYVEEGITGTALPIATKSWPRIQPKYKEDLNVAFPFLKPMRPRPGDSNPNERHTNFTIISITNITMEIRSANWVYHGPKALWDVSDQPKGHNIIAMPQHFKNLLTDMTLHLAKINS
jgi:hypothetical protein